MEPRLASLIGGGALLVAVGLALALSDGDDLEVGDTAPAPIADRERPVLAWVFLGEDCLECDTPARLLRRVRARFGDRLDLRAVAVDDTAALARPFLRRERLSLTLDHLDRATYRETFGNAPLPALYLTSGHAIVGVWRAGRSEPEDLASDTPVTDALQRVLARPARARRAPRGRVKLETPTSNLKARIP